ncbi:MYXO-CTERM sorting domain-containing protein [Sorangium sp. So ce131]|uniref:MYXO-CTERM sorting domain-containing protein n=1 Tax=Sorangium sp. So ce131 TaxID=3133282 RepID=UPI003F5D9ADF
MRRPLLLLSLTALATLASARPAGASEWHAVRPGSPAADLSLRGAADARGAAEVYLKRAASELRLEGVSLGYRNELQAGAHRTIRFAQTHAGLPVLGASAAVRVGPDGRAEVVVLDVARDLTVPTAPKVGAQAAVAAVEAAFGMTLLRRPSPSLAVLPDAEAGGKLVWIVDVPSARGGDRYLVDAHAGGVVHRRPLAVDVRGRVYPISSVVTPELADVELTDLDVTDPQTLSGWSGNFKVANYVEGDAADQSLVLEQSVGPNMGEDFLYDPPAEVHDVEDQFAQVGIYYHLTRMRDYFAEAHQLDMSSPDWKLVAVANVLDRGRPLENAYFAPYGAADPFGEWNLIAIGQGDSFDYSGDSDVFLHEFTHYVSANAIDYNEGQFAINEYGLSPWGGSLDEGLADYFACSVNGDPSLGEASLAILGAGRDLSDSAMRCPDDLLGEVHEDGKIIGSLAWSLREQLGQERGDRLVWGAMTLLTRNASFDDFVRGLRTTADSMALAGELTAADIGALEALIESRGLDDCGEVLDLSGGEARRTTMFGINALLGGGDRACMAVRGQISLQSLFHFKSTPAPGAKGLRFTVDLDARGGDDLSWNIYVRAGKHVRFSAPPGGLPEATTYDYSVEGITAAQGEIVIDDTSDPPFDPALTYYMVIGHENCPMAIATVSSADVVLEPVPEPEVPVEPEVDPPGSATPEPAELPEDTSAVGCACRAAEPSAPLTPWAALAGLALAGAAMLRRRRKTA